VCTMSFDWQLKYHRCTVIRVVRRPQPTTVIFHNRAHDRQTDAQTFGFGSEKDIEYARHYLRIDPPARIANGNLYTTGFTLFGPDSNLTRVTAVALGRRFERIRHQIHHSLNKVRLVADHSRKRSGRVKVHRDALACGLSAHRPMNIPQKRCQIYCRHFDRIAFNECPDVRTMSTALELSSMMSSTAALSCARSGLCSSSSFRATRALH